jgi:hypothetical protein
LAAASSSGRLCRKRLARRCDFVVRKLFSKTPKGLENFVVASADTTILRQKRCRIVTFTKLKSQNQYFSALPFRTFGCATMIGRCLSDKHLPVVPALHGRKIQAASSSLSGVAVAKYICEAVPAQGAPDFNGSRRWK